MRFTLRILFTIWTLGLMTVSAQTTQKASDAGIVENEFFVSSDDIEKCKRNVITSSKHRFVCDVRLDERDAADLVIESDSAKFTFRKYNNRLVKSYFTATPRGYKVSIDVPFSKRNHKLRRASAFLSKAFSDADGVRLQVSFVTAKH